jgi:hypothetical protein
MRKRSFREWLKLTLQHSTQRCAARLFRKRVRGLWSAEAKLPPDAEGGRTAVRPSPTLWERGQGGEGNCLPPAPTQTQQARQTRAERNHTRRLRHQHREALVVDLLVKQRDRSRVAPEVIVEAIVEHLHA